MQNKIIINKEQKILTSKEGKVYVGNPSNVGTNSDIKAELDKKQDKLTAGDGITIEDNVISCENKMKLVATGTYIEADGMQGDAVYKLDNKLEPNKMYYIERYDDLTGEFYSCITRTNEYDVSRKTINFITVIDDNGEFINAEVNILEFLLENSHCIVLTTYGKPFYYCEYDEIYVYELPFTF